MKTEKKKSKESLIGKIIYGFLLFMPLLSVLVTCLYVIQNDNAHESYYGETINEQTNIKAQNLNVNNTLYYIDNQQLIYTYGQTATIYVSNFKINNNNLSQNDLTTLQQYTNYRIEFVYTSENGNRMLQMYYLNNGNYTFLINLFPNTNNFIFEFIINSSTLRNGFSTENIYYIEYNKNSYLDDAFMYGLQKTEESQYFNWAKNTALYTGVNEFTNALGITTTYIPFLMTYWLLISVVYLIYDIALMMLHMAHNKIHQLEGSI